MSKHLTSLFLIAALAGCAGETFKPKAVISDVEPNFVAIGRSKQVEIHGDFTRWKESSLDVTDISFGADITVDELTIANEGFLLVTITASPTAAPGPRDIDVDGEELLGAFFVNPAFEVLNSTIVQGDFAMLDIIGYDTDWLAGRTTVSFDDGVYTDGSDLFEATFTNVLGPNFLQAFVQADPFATAGGRTITIEGLTKTDSVPDAVTIEAASFAALNAGNNVLSMENAGGVAAKVRIPAGTAPSIQQLIASAGTGEPIGLILDPDLGSMEPVGFIGDESNFFVDPEYRVLNATTGKDLYVLFWDSNWLDDVFFGDIATEGDPLGADLFYAAYSGSALTATVSLVDQVIAAPNGLAVYNVTAANRWNLVTVDVTTPDGAATIDGVLDAAREGSLHGVLVEEPADASGSGGDESLTYLAGGGLDAQVIWEAYGSGTQSGATSKHTIVFDEAAPAGMLFAANDVALAIPDEGQVDSNLVVTGATTAITAVHVLVDLDHTWRGDLTISLESPSGTIVEVYSGSSFDDRDGLIEAFPDTLAESGNLGDFVTEDANGTWILHVVDSAEPDGGVVRGWALSFEGV